MNYVDLFIIVLFLVIVFEGYARGFLVSLLSLIRFAVGIPVSFLVAENYSTVVYTNCFRESINTQVLNGIENSGLEQFVSSVKDSVNALPSVFKGSADLSFLNNATAASAADGVMKNIVDPVADRITQIVLFVITIVVFYIVTGLILFAAKKLSNSKHAPFRKTNKFLGAAFGFVKALIFVFAISKIGAFFTENLNSVDNSFLQQVASSGIIEFVNKFNPIDMIGG
ncbi:MAG: CvpA family protein [Eubacterium sp.]|nr:CvpA family protein [Eubacterium sp.]